MVVVRWGIVDSGLDTGGVAHGDGSKQETKRDTHDGTHRDTDTAEQRVYNTVHQRDKDDKSNGINVLHNVVGHVASQHGTGLRYKVACHLIVTEPVNRVPAENNTCTKSTPEFINKDIVPSSLGQEFRVIDSEVGWLACLHAALDLEAEPEETTGFDKDRATGRVLDVTLATKHNDANARNEHTGRKQVGRPETNVLFHVGGSDGRQGANVDTPVEHVEDLLVSSLRSDDNALATLEGLNVRTLGAVLFGDQGRDIGLDTTGTETDDDDTDNETREGCTAGDGSGDRSAGQDEQTNQVDDTKGENGVVFAEILVSNDGSKNRRNIAPELEEGIQSSSGLLAAAQSTGLFGRV